MAFSPGVGGLLSLSCEESAGSMSTTVTVYEEGKKTEGNYSLSDAHAASREDPPAVVWISLVEPSKEELDSVAQHFGPQELEQEDTETRKGVILRYQGRRLTLMVSPAQGADRFEGRQLHTKDYRTAGEFAGRNVIVVGGVSAIQLLDEVSRVTTTTWLTRRPPEFREGTLYRGPRSCRCGVGRRPGAQRVAAQIRGFGNWAACNPGYRGNASPRGAGPSADVRRDPRRRRPLARRHRCSCRCHSLVHRFSQLPRSPCAADAA